MNYLFAVKSDNWLLVKTSYDMADGQEILFMKPPEGLVEEDIRCCESKWSQWLALQDWIPD